MSTLSGEEGGKCFSVREASGHRRYFVCWIPNADIAALADYWQVCPTLKDAIFKSSARTGYSDLSITTVAINETVLSNKEFEAFRTHVLGCLPPGEIKTRDTREEIRRRLDPKFTEEYSQLEQATSSAAPPPGVSGGGLDAKNKTP